MFSHNKKKTLRAKLLKILLKKSFIPIDNFSSYFCCFSLCGLSHSVPCAPFPLSLPGPSFFLPSSALLPRTQTSLADKGEGEELMERRTEVLSALTHGLCSAHLPQWPNPRKTEVEGLLSEKHWVGLMPGSIVLF